MDASTTTLRAAGEAVFAVERSVLSLGAVYALAATVVFVVLLVLLNRGCARFVPDLAGWARKRIPSLKIQSLELLPSSWIVDALEFLAEAARVGLVLLLCYFYLTTVLSLFPWSRGWSAALFEYLLRPLRSLARAATTYIPNLFFIGVTLVCAHYVLKAVRLVFTGIKYGRLVFAGFYPEWADPTFQIVRVLVWAFTLVIVFPYLPGSNSPAFKGVSVFIGVLLSLGSGSAIGNAVAGVILTYMRPFKVGDRVKIGESVGDVVEKTLLITRVRTIKNEDITVPNATVLGNHIVNYSSSAPDLGLILHTGVTIGYDAPWKKVHELLLAAAAASEGILKEPAPFVLQTSLDDFFVSYQLNAYTREPRQMAEIYSRLHQNIQDRFNEAGVEIMSPHFSALRDGNAVAIPEAARPKGYRPPAFRVDAGGLPEKS